MGVHGLGVGLRGLHREAGAAAGQVVSLKLLPLPTGSHDVLQCGDVEVPVEVRDRLTDQLCGVELNLVDGPVVDPTPQFLELLAREIGFVQRNLLRLAVIGGHRQIKVENVDQGPHEVDD